MKNLILFFTLSLVTVGCLAQSVTKERVALVELKAHVPSPLPATYIPKSESNLDSNLDLKSNFETQEIDWGTVIKIGKEIWQIIEDNEPVLDYQSSSAGAVPPVENWLQMSGWKDRYWKDWQWEWKNLLGFSMVNFEWAFSFRCNGQYQGKGHYVSEATVAIKAISVMWGETVNVHVTSMSPANYGTVEDPIGGLDIEITMEISNVFQKEVQKCRVNLRGDCSGRIVSCDGYY